MKQHNRDKHPEIWSAKESAEKKLAELLEKRKVHTDKMKLVQAKIQPLRDEKESLNKSAMVDADEIKELRTSISTFARSMGAVVAGEK